MSTTEKRHIRERIEAATTTLQIVSIDAVPAFFEHAPEEVKALVRLTSGRLQFSEEHRAALVELNRWTVRQCGYCGGRGTIQFQNQPAFACQTCNGTGQVWKRQTPKAMRERLTCKVCGGTREHDPRTGEMSACDVCDGQPENLTCGSKEPEP